MKTNFFLIISLAVFLFTCKKDKVAVENQPCTSCVSCAASGNQPTIAYKSQRYNHDSLFINFNFCDKDGDLGLGINDTAESVYSSNLFAVYYFKDSTGNWSVWDENPSTPQIDTLIFKYHIPTLQTPPVSSAITYGISNSPLLIFLRPSQILEGEIEMKLTYPYAYPLHHEIKFEIFIHDKALNKSNRITTPSIYP